MRPPPLRLGLRAFAGVFSCPPAALPRCAPFAGARPPRKRSAHGARGGLYAAAPPAAAGGSAPGAEAGFFIRLSSAPPPPRGLVLVTPQPFCVAPAGRKGGPMPPPLLARHGLTASGCGYCGGRPRGWRSLRFIPRTARYKNSTQAPAMIKWSARAALKLLHPLRRSAQMGYHGGRPLSKDITLALQGSL